eukprot:TRINITY_DN8815_c0_g1_i1.p1 TRINITY_DN8815_c0_g1~~TRINITY_DN8815_c0_g1_i1.p1  ORF type:complete len:293 (+),score=66.30 TRINITY_DN8815_c0_g1_i1:93-971(+)
MADTEPQEDSDTQTETLSIEGIKRLIRKGAPFVFMVLLVKELYEISVAPHHELDHKTLAGMWLIAISFVIASVNATADEGWEDITKTPPRIGIDIDGVLTKYHMDGDKGDIDEDWYEKETSATPFAMEAVTELVVQFGADNVFIISKASERGLKKHLEQWLHETMDICGKTGLLRKNIYFCSDVGGKSGKGAFAQNLGISHFVDDRDENLKAMYLDEAGNTQPQIDRHKGQLFHFAVGGEGTHYPRGGCWKLAERPDCVLMAAGWTDLLGKLKIAKKGDAEAATQQDVKKDK